MGVITGADALDQDDIVCISGYKFSGGQFLFHFMQQQHPFILTKEVFIRSEWGCTGSQDDDAMLQFLLLLLFFRSLGNHCLEIAHKPVDFFNFGPGINGDQRVRLDPFD